MTRRVSRITVYPMKSGAPRDVERALVTKRGLSGDRELMIVDEGGSFVTQREHPTLALCEAEIRGDDVHLRLPSGEGASARVAPDAPTREVRVWGSVCRALDAGDDLGALLSAYLARPVRLVRIDPTFERAVDLAYGAPGDVVSFADGYPLLAVTEASLADLNARLPSPVTIGRFRANVVVEGATAFEEDAWSSLAIGPARFDVVKPCARCQVVNVDPATGTRSPEVLKALGGYRVKPLGIVFGQNLIPRAFGEIRVGDPVVVASTTPGAPQ